MSVGADAIKRRLEKAEREVAEHKIKAQMMTDRYHVQCDLLRNDAESAKKAKAERFRLEQDRMIAEANELKNRCQEAGARADAAAERGKIIADQMAEARRNVEDKAAMMREMEALRLQVSELMEKGSKGGDGGQSQGARSW